MSSTTLPPTPASFKPIQHYLKTATEHDQRNPVVAYYCRLYALQRGMEIDKASPEAKTFLLALMDFLEMVKKSNPDSEAIHSEQVGQAYIEDYALKLFLHADNEDRAGRFNRGVVKSFYTAGMIFDVLAVFGGISEEFEKHKKYAKWKAAYINRCLKTGETPHAGPLDEEGAPEDPSVPSSSGGPPSAGIGFDNLPSVPGGFVQPQDPPYQPPAANYQPPGATYQPPQNPLPPANQGGSNQRTNEAPARPQQPPTKWTPPENATAAKLTQAQIQTATKYCKYAQSALMYDDTNTAIDNLTKCLKLLTTGQDQ